MKNSDALSIFGIIKGLLESAILVDGKALRPLTPYFVYGLKRNKIRLQEIIDSVDEARKTLDKYKEDELELRKKFAKTSKGKLNAIMDKGKIVNYHIDPSKQHLFEDAYNEFKKNKDEYRLFDEILEQDVAFKPYKIKIEKVPSILGEAPSLLEILDPLFEE